MIARHKPLLALCGKRCFGSGSGRLFNLEDSFGTYFKDTFSHGSESNSTIGVESVKELEFPPSLDARLAEVPYTESQKLNKLKNKQFSD